MLLLDLPTVEQLNNKMPITMLAAPPSATLDIDPQNLPIKEALLAAGWKEVRVPHAPARSITTRGLHAQRHQYALCHLGNSTIHKLQGATISGKLAVEVSRASSPWMKEQVRQLRNVALAIFTSNCDLYHSPRLWSCCPGHESERM